ncbi:MYB FAMILY TRANSCRIPTION FACTOR [Salix purpurea]|uniref:MYB FAMILY TRANSCRIPTION FACTOR n=1 Tax=Salix purpurea TaxID=77065 RepID=A0A9Q0ZHH9_SALPP|nr:MYB FAMILY TRANSCRIPTION FACTOR [Salix purpurea]
MKKPAPAPIYASSTENIARLLKGWMINGPKQSLKNSTTTQNSFINMAGADLLSGEGTPDKADKNGTGLSQTFESLFGFDSFDSSNSDFSQPMSPDTGLFQDESKPNSGGQVPLSLIERWLFDEGAMQGKDYLNEVTIDEDNLF